jgi:hypothetical protein
LFLGLADPGRSALDRARSDDLRGGARTRASTYAEALATRFALEHRSITQTVLDQVDDAERRVYVAADNLRAVLDRRRRAPISRARRQTRDFD